jgi:hypothetical protein
MHPPARAPGAEVQGMALEQTLKWRAILQL